MIEVVLKCCTCEEEKNTVATNPPQTGLDYASIIKGAGWRPVFDPIYNRLLCFCCAECERKQRTKSGGFRERLIHIPKGEKQSG